MLLWELAFEKIPYENWDTNKITEHVLANKRERVTFDHENENHDIQNLKKKYMNIIISGE